MHTHYVPIDEDIYSIAQNVCQLKTFWNADIFFLVP